MNVIRHDHVPANYDSAAECHSRKSNEAAMYPIIRQKPSSAMRVKCDEIQRRIVLLKGVQSWGTIGHAKQLEL